MNERIRKLAIKSGIDIRGHLNGVLTLDEKPSVFDLEKFAELIVKECANAADMAQDAGCEYAGDYVAEYMGYGEQEGVTEWRAK